jgi:transcriptional antiterminator NusG
MDTGERTSEQTTLATERIEPTPESSATSGEPESTEIVASELAAAEGAKASLAEAAAESTLAEVAEEVELAGKAEEAPLAQVAEGETEVEPETGEASGEVEEEITDDRAWYVIHCYSGYESKVKHNLEQRIETMQMQDKIFQVVVPTEDEIEVRDGKRRVVERRVFPGYILVQMVLTDDSWYVVRNTPGVTGFVGMGNEPTPLRPEEVQAILKRMEAEAPKVKVTYKSGQKVRIIDGPFNEFIGVVDDIDMERAKVRVMVSFFGRETPVELDFLQVEKA